MKTVIQHQVQVIKDRDEEIDSLKAKIKTLTNKNFEEEFRAN